MFFKIFCYFFWYVSNMICCCDFFWRSFAVMMLIRWYGFRYDFDMVSVVILDVGPNCALKPTQRNHIQNPIKTRSKSYQNHINRVSKPYQNRIKIISKSYHNNIKIISQPQKRSKNRPKTSCWVVSVFFCSQLNRTISKSYQNHIKS